MKKTLLIELDFWPNVGGVATYWKNICNNLPKDKIVVLTVGKPQGINDNFAFKIIRKPLIVSYLWPRWITSIWLVWSTYKKNNCEQVIVGEVLPLGLVLLLINKIIKLPYIVQVHGKDLLMCKKNKRKYYLARRIFKKSKHVLANSRYVGKLLESEFGVEKNKYTVVYPLVNQLPDPDEKLKKRIKEKFGLKDKKVVLFVGRSVERKGQDMLIKSMVLVKQKLKNVVLVCVGSGPYKKELMDLAIIIKVDVIFAGKVSDKELSCWYSLCDVFAMPARQIEDDVEGFGIVYLQAYDFSKPVIAGRAGGAIEAVRHKKSGIIVDPENIHEISDAIQDLLNNESKAKEYGVYGKQWIKQDFSKEKILGNFKRACL